MQPIISKIDKSWSLFLDRDGVINKRLLGDYVKTTDQMELLPKVEQAICRFSKQFGHIFVVTNQQGIGKGLMTEQELDVVHQFMLDQIEKAEGHIDKIYFSPYLETSHHSSRKPAPGMAIKAKKEFPEIRFKKSIMVGDSLSDMLFGKRLQMTTVFISDDNIICKTHSRLINFCFPSLFEFSKLLK